MKYRINNLFVFSLVFVLAIIAVGCQSDLKNNQANLIIFNPEYGDWQYGDEPPVQFEEVQRYGVEKEPNEVILSEIKDIFTDDSLNVFILDNELNKLLSFNPDGELRWAVGERGKGPGDFENPQSMVWDGNNYIYILNSNGTRIDQFDTCGRYIKTLSMTNLLKESPFGLKLIGFINGHLLIFSGIDSEFAGTFFLTSPESPSEPLKSFVVNLTGETEVPWGMHHFSPVSIIDNQIVIPDVHSYTLYFYEANMNTETVSRNFPYIVRPGFYDDGTDRYMGTFSEINDVLKLNEQYYVTSAYWVKDISDPDKILHNYVTGITKDMEYHSTIDLYDEDWKLLYSVESDKNIHPDIGQPVHVDQNGHLYSKAYFPYPMLRN